MNNFEQIQLGHSYAEKDIQDIGSKENKEIKIYGNHFNRGKMVIHVSFQHGLNDCWFVFYNYKRNQGSFFKCIYKE
mgnify:CR=1 FL=1